MHRPVLYAWLQAQPNLSDAHWSVKLLCPRMCFHSPISLHLSCLGTPRKKCFFSYCHCVQAVLILSFELNSNSSSAHSDKCWCLAGLMFAMFTFSVKPVVRIIRDKCKLQLRLMVLQGFDHVMALRIVHHMYYNSSQNGPWMYESNFMDIRWIVVEIFQSGPKWRTDQPTWLKTFWMLSSFLEYVAEVSGHRHPSP